MSEYNETLASFIITVLAVVGLPLLAHLLTTASSYLRTRAEDIKERRTRELVIKAIETVEQAVLYVMQSYVDGLKGAGKFDKKAQEKAFEMAKTRAEMLISSGTIQIIEEAYGSFDTWLTTRIEQTVRNNKY